MCTHGVDRSRVKYAMSLAMPAIAIEDDADVTGDRLALYLSSEPALIQTIQRSERPT